MRISASSGSSTPKSSYRPSTRQNYSPGSSQNLGKAECSNCKFLAEKIKTLEALMFKRLSICDVIRML